MGQLTRGSKKKYFEIMLREKKKKPDIRFMGKQIGNEGKGKSNS